MAEGEPTYEESLSKGIIEHVIRMAMSLGATPDQAGELLHDLADRDALRDLPEEIGILHAAGNLLQSGRDDSPEPNHNSMGL